ncbi:hypothetical protein [Aquabacterium sp.]|nr:hypothetical protein [Aquabacterium sp.]
MASIRPVQFAASTGYCLAQNKTPDENIGRFGLTGVSEACQVNDLTSG